MKTYLTKADADSALGPDWAPADKKDEAVLIANVWMTNRQLPDLDPIPAEWTQAAAYVARDAAAGRIYGATETGVLSKTVKAEVEVSKTFSASVKTYTAGESLALALIKPWLSGMGSVMFLKRV